MLNNSSKLRFGIIFVTLLISLSSNQAFTQEEMNPDLRNALRHLDTPGGQKWVKRFSNFLIDKNGKDKWAWYGLGKVYDSMTDRDSALYCYE